MIHLVEVNNWKRLSQFLELPQAVYSTDEMWVPPLRLQTLLLMGWVGDRSRRFLLAFEGELPVARIGVKLHRHQDTEALHFGFFECLEGYPEAARLLIEKAHETAPELPMRGPYNFRMEDPYTGLLVEGFEEPSFWSAYNPAYYLDYLEAAGLTKIMDLWTYRGDWESARLRPIERRAGLAAKSGITIRTLDPKHRFRDIQEVVRTMNASLQENWGFEDFGQAQVWELYLLSFLFLDPAWLFLAEHQGKTVGACIVLGDYNPWMKESRGRFTPSLLWKLLRGKGELGQVRAWGLGVLPEFRAHKTAPALIWAAIEQGRKRSTQSMEVSWVLESNAAMNAMLRACGAYHFKTHRVLERPGSKA